MQGSCHCLWLNVVSSSIQINNRGFVLACVSRPLRGTMEEAAEKASMRAAAEELSQEFKTLVDTEDLDSLKQLQQLILGRLQDSNAVLSHFNEFSESCFTEVSADFSRNTRLLKSMKSDLDYIFQKLRYFLIVFVISIVVHVC
ncbi:OLC1v1024261C1 [Oldenlandia corymbosa var. corymbosa]|uniref:OLC1v1024261C1 n=1 Tax=Oldenlandia corymbosa var. corymbosa TaxID=529605 RepID=A0AAV1C3M5_OLDCO|nr:OLC1v1024261C1 [Oldenlandia corymbosa var. corymbosa]